MVLATAVFAAVALFAPRAVIPNRLPALVLDAQAAEDAMALDRARALRAPSGRWARELRELHATIGRGAHEPTHSAHEVRRTYRLAQTRTRAVRQSHGEAGLWALRAQAVVELPRALAHEMPTRARLALLGKFEEQLVRHHVRSTEGDLRAPMVVVWALFKARWNQIGGLAPTAGFEPVEVQAYEGWLALHGVGAPATRRFAAARRFERAGGRRGSEAVAVWAMRVGNRRLANEALERALRDAPNVRLRNYALALAPPR